MNFFTIFFFNSILILSQIETKIEISTWRHCFNHYLLFSLTQSKLHQQHTHFGRWFCMKTGIWSPMNGMRTFRWLCWNFKKIWAIGWKMKSFRVLDKLAGIVSSSSIFTERILNGKLLVWGLKGLRVSLFEQL